MNILILGGGKVGQLLCKELSNEPDMFITIIEQNPIIFERLISRYDISGLCADGSDIGNLLEAGVKDADIFLAVSQKDEINLITATIAKRLGAKKTIARVRGKSYFGHIDLLKQSLGVDLIMNPDTEAARTIARNLRFPFAISIENFHKYHVNMVGIYISDSSSIANMSMVDFGKKYDLNTCLIERENEETIIPSGKDVILPGDILHVTGSRADLMTFYNDVGYLDQKPLKNIIIIGGGKLTDSLLEHINTNKLNIKVIEHNLSAAEALSEKYENISVIHGDGTDQEFLLEENFEKYDCSISLTGIDEENLLISMYAKKLKIPKIITKLNRGNLTNLLHSNELIHSVITPKRIITDMAIGYIRSLQNTTGSNIEEYSTVADGKAEILQFIANKNSKTIGKNLSELDIKRGVLVAYMVRDGELFFPRGNTCIEPNDRVVVVSKIRDFTDLDNILDE